MKPRVLLVEDDIERGQLVARALSDRFDCRHVATIEEAMRVLPAQRWGAVIVDYDLAGGGSGLEVLQVVRETAPQTFRLFYSVYSSPSLMRDVQRLAHPHFVIDAREVGFIPALKQALDDLLAPPLAELPANLQPILTEVWIARAPVAVDFLRELRAASEQDVPAYVYGEPGTGRTRAALTLRQWRQEWKARGATGTSRGVVPVPIIRVPSLRERLQDLPVLAARILLEYQQRGGEPLRRLSARALEDLLAREWRGNIVELSGVLVRAIQRAGARTLIEPEDLPHDTQPAWRPSQYAKDEGQRDCVLRQLRTARNVSAAARLEGCSRANYIRLMRRLGIIRADVAVDMVSQAQDDVPEEA